MDLIEHYFFCFPAEDYTIDHPQATTVAEIADKLHCSERNTKFVLRKMEEQRWISWQPGRGRGHRSFITFHRLPKDLLRQQTEEWLRQGHIQQAIRLLELPGINESTARALRQIISAWLGLHTKVNHNRPRDIIRLAFGRHLSALDPLRVSITTEVHLARQLFDTLVRYNLEKKTFEPQIAHHWDCSSDKKQWTFYLRKGILFHHGRELTARDVTFTFNRVMSPSSPCAWYFKELLLIEQAGRYTLRLVFSRPAGFLLHLLSSIHTAILPADASFQEEKLIGTGPFQLKSRTKDTLILTRFENYYRERMLLDEVAIYYLPHAERSVAIFTQQKTSSDPVDLQPFTTEECGCRYLSFNFNKSGPQMNRTFRQAVRLIFDRQIFLKDLRGDRRQPADSFFRKFSEQASFTSHPLTEAEVLLKESGYSGETMQLYCFDQPGSREDALWLMHRARLAGLNLSVHPFPMTDFFNPSIDSKADLLLAGEVFDEDIPLSFISMLKDETVFFRRFLNAEQRQVVDKIANALMACSDEAFYWKMIQQLEGYLREHMIILFNYHSNQASAFSKELSGIQLNAYGWADFSKLWIKPANNVFTPVKRY
ncbi:MAG: ABC transporter substrate-binding protein [Sporolactobacillus sp.]